MERSMNEENDWDNNVEGDAVGLVVCVSRDMVPQALNKMKNFIFSRSITRVDC